MNVTGTKLDLQCERNLRKILHKLKKQFRKHHVLFQATIKEQKHFLDSLWVLCQQFLILTRDAICVQPYPSEITKLEEREIREKFRAKKDLLRASLSKIALSLGSVKEMCFAFDGALGKIDTSVPNSIVEGNRSRQPIFYYIELFFDLFKTFHKALKQLKLMAQFLIVDDIPSILEYQKLLEKTEEANEYNEECFQINNKWWF